MPKRDIGGGFRDVDNSGDARAFIAYLDEAGNLLAGLKRELIAALSLGPGDAALDVGCGTGEDLRSLAAVVGPSGRVVGVDRSEDLVAEARSRMRGSAGVEVLVGDAQALPFCEDEFSAARVERVLMHVDEPRAVLRELARVTRPAGRVVVTEPDWDTLIVDSDDLGMARRVARAHAERIRNPDIGRRLTRLASQAGLEVSAVRCTTIAIHEVAVAEAQFQLLTAVGNVGEDAQRWWQRLIGRSPAQPFFAAVTAVTVIAHSGGAQWSSALAASPPQELPGRCVQRILAPAPGAAQSAPSVGPEQLMWMGRSACNEALNLVTRLSDPSYASRSSNVSADLDEMDVMDDVDVATARFGVGAKPSAPPFQAKPNRASDRESQPRVRHERGGGQAARRPARARGR